MKKQFITMEDGKKIYVQIYEKGHKDYLLMLHGGPGQGCYDFQYQATKLSESVNVTIFDQRGSLRSDRIEDSEPFGLEFIINDCENLRNILGISSWSILGHSFGGMIALLYATKYPKSIEKVIFESPSFNFLMSMRSVYFKSAEIFQRQGKLDDANKLKEFAENNNLRSLVDNIGQITTEVRSEVYHNSEQLEEVKVINNLMDITEKHWENGKIHFERLLCEGEINKDFMPLLSGFQCPSVLILGKYDPICCTEQYGCYLKESMNGKIITFDKSGHTPHNDEPYKFTEVVSNFLCY